MKHFKFMCLALAILFSLNACNARDKDIESPLVGKTVTLKSSLYILNGLENFEGFTDSPTEMKIGNVALTMDDLKSCIGCHFNRLRLKDFLLSGSHIEIITAYETTPPFFHIDSTTTTNYIAKTSDGVQFTISTYSLEDLLKNSTPNHDEAAKFERYLDSFADDKETKSFYINVKEFEQKSLFPNKQPPFSSDDVKETFKDFFADAEIYNIKDINTHTGQLAFSMTTDRKGLAYFFFKTSERYIDISLFSTLPNREK